MPHDDHDRAAASYPLLPVSSSSTSTPSSTSTKFPSPDLPSHRSSSDELDELSRDFDARRRDIARSTNKYGEREDGDWERDYHTASGLGIRSDQTPSAGKRVKHIGIACSLLFGWTILIAAAARRDYSGGILASSSIPFKSPTTNSVPINPYSLPGLVLGRPVNTTLPHPGNWYGFYNKVRWDPMSPFEGTDSERRLNRRDAEEDEDGAVDNLLERLADFINSDTDDLEEDWHWARNKTVLAIGDSLNRNNINYLATHLSPSLQRKVYHFEDELGTLWNSNHYMGVVDVPRINLKIANWFHMGMIEEPNTYFFPGQSLPLRFEEKLEKVFLPTINHPKGLDGRTPDLIIFESLSWDLVAMHDIAGAAGDRRNQGRPLDDIELEWYRGRYISVLKLVKDTFPNAKIILQTSHLGSKPEDNVFSPVRKFQQAQAVQSISLETGHPLFDWGKVVSPLSNELEDGLHFRPGAATWMWSEMMLYYLRATTQSPSPVRFVSPDSPPPSSYLPPTTVSRKRVSQQELIASYSSDPKIDYPMITGPQRKREESDGEDSSMQSVRARLMA